MPPKRKRPNQPNNPRPPHTVSCTLCGDPIVVPKTCRHGKKLTNCQGTDCVTAHLQEHKAQCPVQAMNRATIKTPTGVSQAKTNHELQVLIILIAEEIAKIEQIRGKPLKYLEGVPKEEWIKDLKIGDVSRARDWARILKDVGDGKKTFEEVEYDDEESDLEGDVCPTPPEED